MATAATATNPGHETHHSMSPIDSAQMRRFCMCETRFNLVTYKLNHFILTGVVVGGGGVGNRTGGGG